MVRIHAEDEHSVTCLMSDEEFFNFPFTCVLYLNDSVTLVILTGTKDFIALQVSWGVVSSDLAEVSRPIFM